MNERWILLANILIKKGKKEKPDPARPGFLKIFFGFLEKIFFEPPEKQKQKTYKILSLFFFQSMPSLVDCCYTTIY
jgi:hypothetical protein